MNDIKKTQGYRCALTSAAAVCVMAGSASAWLGGFENADGYQAFLNRVEGYNAGQYGSASGYTATSPVAIPTNTGLWTLLSSGGSSGGGTSYATGHQWFDRTNVNAGLSSEPEQGLVLTTAHEGWTGPALKYGYSLDSQDLAGTAPSATAGSTIEMSFWWCAQLAGTADFAGGLAEGYFGDEIQFLDSGGNIGFTLGLTQRAGGDKVTYWDGSSMLESTITAAASRYDRWDITLDLAAGTVSADYFSFFGSTTTTLISGASLMNPMADFTNMTFRTSPGTTNAKLLSVDDFSFDVVRVPAPGAMGLLALGLFGRRRR